MKLLHKLVLPLVAVAALFTATNTAQARWFHRGYYRHHVIVGYGYPYYGYYGPAYYGPAYYGYGPYYGGGVTFSFGGHRHYRYHHYR